MEVDENNGNYNGNMEILEQTFSKWLFNTFEKKKHNKSTIIYLLNYKSLIFF